MIRIYSEKVLDKSKSQEKSKKEIEVWASQKELEEGEQKLLKIALESDKLMDYYFHLLYSLYTVLPPRRAMDYGTMLIDPPDTTKNNSVITSGKSRKFEKFIFNDYKLSEKKGSESFDRNYIKSLPNGQTIILFLDAWLKMNLTEYFLLVPKTANNMTKRVSILMEKTLNKKININILRHIYITNFLNKNPFLLEKELVSMFMSHSLGMEEKYRKRDETENLEILDVIEGE